LNPASLLPISGNGTECVDSRDWYRCLYRHVLLWEAETKLCTVGRRLKAGKKAVVKLFDLDIWGNGVCVWEYLTFGRSINANSGGLWYLLSCNRTIALNGPPENLGEIPRRFGLFLQWIARVI
jgi:hypothetical protein